MKVNLMGLPETRKVLNRSRADCLRILEQGLPVSEDRSGSEVKIRNTVESSIPDNQGLPEVPIATSCRLVGGLN